MKKTLLLVGFAIFSLISNAQTVSTFPYNEDFEGWSTCGTGAGTPCTLPTPWFNAAGDDVDWTTDINGTGSGSTGPTANGGADFNPGISGGTYLYIESSATAGNPNSVADLESPWFDFSLLTVPVMEYAYHMLGASMGTLQLDARTTGNGTWTTIVAPYTDNIDQWQLQVVPLLAFAGEDSVQFRWKGITGTSYWSDMALDDINVYQPEAVDFEMVSIDSLSASGCGLGVEDVWCTTIQNGTTGLAIGDTLFFDYSDGTTTISDTVVLAAPIGPLGTYNHMFSQSVDYSTSGSYAISITVSATADSNVGDNNLSTTLVSVPTIVIDGTPHLENFENGPNGWVIDNTNNGSWAFGTPAHSIMNSAASGDSAFSTGNLTGDYNSNENSWLTSPCFDFTNAIGDEWVALSAWWQSEDSWDGTNLNYSIDGGNTWTIIGAFGDPYNWYTDNSINGAPGGNQDGWEGNSNGWVTAKQSLPASLMGVSDVKFRVNFGSDGSVTEEGFSFDDFTIASPPAYDQFPDSMLVCDTLFAGDAGAGWSSYLWDNGETTQVPTSIVTPGYHWVEISDSLGLCARDSVFVTFLPSVPPNLEDWRVICYPDSTIIDAGTDTLTTYTYSWSTMETSQMITVNTGGLYEVTKTDSTGNCVMTDSIEIILAQVDLGGATEGYCTGNIPTLDAGISGASYLWNTNETTQMITPTGPGAYAVTVIDTNGCVLIDAIDLVESIPLVDLGGDQTICVNYTLTLDAENPGAGYVWSDGSTSQTLLLDGSVLGIGTFNYDVTVTDSIGCTGTDAVAITVDECAGIEELGGVSMTLYPNPSSGVFTYTITDFSETINVKIVDVSGKIIQESDLNSAEGTIDLTQFENGIYMMNIQVGEFSNTVRLIKQ